MAIDETPQARVIFTGIQAKKFNALKNYYGLTNNAELVRLLVILRYDELKKDGAF